ncbi:mucin-2-like [Wyeomyia smithii]|uniref:mucin-2-like n=1 Tax=Wyeomyia smithii TaxID=174621 RepID=UPI00246810B9|nr:mucin-2-like [Wyeomyia smithii]
MKPFVLFVVVAIFSLTDGALLHLLSTGLALKAHALKAHAVKAHALKAKPLESAVPVVFKFHVAPPPPLRPYPPANVPPSHYGQPSTTLPPPPPTTTLPPPPPPPPTTTPLPPVTTTPVPPPLTTVYEPPPTYGPPHAVYGPPQPAVTEPQTAYVEPTQEPPHNPEDCPLTVLQDNLYNLKNTYGQNPTSSLVVYPAVQPNTDPANQENLWWQTVIDTPSSPSTGVQDPTAQQDVVVQPAGSTGTGLPSSYPVGPNRPAVEDPSLSTSDPANQGNLWRQTAQPAGPTETDQSGSYPAGPNVPASEDPSHSTYDPANQGNLWWQTGQQNGAVQPAGPTGTGLSGSYPAGPNGPASEDPSLSTSDPTNGGNLWWQTGQPAGPTETDQSGSYPAGPNVPAGEDPNLSTSGPANEGNLRWQTVIDMPSSPSARVEDPTAQQNVGVQPVVPAETDLSAPYPAGLNVPTAEGPNNFVDFNQIGASWNQPNRPAVPAEQYEPAY